MRDDALARCAQRILDSNPYDAPAYQAPYAPRVRELEALGYSLEDALLISRNSSKKVVDNPSG